MNIDFLQKRCNVTFQYEKGFVSSFCLKQYISSKEVRSEISTGVSCIYRRSEQKHRTGCLRIPKRIKNTFRIPVNAPRFQTKLSLCLWHRTFMPFRTSMKHAIQPNMQGKLWLPSTAVKKQGQPGIIVESGCVRVSVAVPPEFVTKEFKNSIEKICSRLLNS